MIDEISLVLRHEHQTHAHCRTAVGAAVQAASASDIMSVSLDVTRNQVASQWHPMG